MSCTGYCLPANHIRFLCVCGGGARGCGGGRSGCSGRSGGCGCRSGGARGCGGRTGGCGGRSGGCCRGSRCGSGNTLTKKDKIPRSYSKTNTTYSVYSVFS